MSFIDRIEGFLIVGSILGLLTVGLVLTLQSGVARFNSGTGSRQLMTNLSHMVLFLGACLAGLAVIQQFVGFRVSLF